jgi:hypothetical protein
MTPHVAVARRGGATLIVFALAAAVLLMVGNTASAAIVPTVPLLTSANYAVLGGQTVTNTGPSTMGDSLGLWPGSSITGFPPGLVGPPGTIDNTNAAAQQAQSDLTAAYVNAAGRPVNTTTTADLVGLTLNGGVYATTSHGALGLSGELTLDGEGDPSSVFIFQTDSTLITASGSTVTLINGAQECNVFWQVGSSATLGTGSDFTGNILALTSITVTNSVTVHGRALARNGAVTLDTDTFTSPTCATATPVTTTTTAAGGGSAGGDTPAGGDTSAGGGSATDLGSGGPGGGPGVPGVVGPPRTGGAPLSTGGSPWLEVLVVGLAAGVGTVGAVLRRRMHARSAVLAKH